MTIRRIPWSYIMGAIIVAALIMLLFSNWIEVRKAFDLLREMRPAWLAVALIAVAAAYVCAGQVYGRVLATLGYRESASWLTTAALVTILINHALPAGTVGSYAFLVVSLRRRGIPPANVATVAALELLSWNGGVILLFTYGLLYLLLTTGADIFNRGYYASFGFALFFLCTILYVVSRSHATLHDWAQRLNHVADRLLGWSWTDEQVLRVVDEIAEDRRLILEQPLRMLQLVGLQMSVFVMQSLALLAILTSLGVSSHPLAVLASYGLALIASTFVVLPGGGGAVEAALTLSLGAQGVPFEAALGAAIIYRLLSFWLLLPFGVIGYRMLTRTNDQETEAR